MSPEPKPILNVSKLVKRFGGFYALDGLSFHVSQGEVLGLVGPNGSGKTTAINVISGLYTPDGGEVMLDEEQQEYPLLYRRFIELAAQGRSDVDLSPLQLVADAFMLGRHCLVEAFDWA